MVETPAAARWSGGLVLTPGLMAFTGDIGDTAAHSHAAVQVLLVTRGRVVLADAAGRTRPAHLAIIPPGIRHEVRAGPGSTGLLAYLDPDSVAGRAAITRMQGLPADEVASWIAAATPRFSASGADGPGPHMPGLGLPSSGLSGTGHGAADSEIPDPRISGSGNSGEPSRRPRSDSHPAVTAALRLATESPSGPPSLVEMADQVALSSSRLSHIFAAHMGLPYAAWRRWTKLLRALDAVQTGASLTEAAHAAGFADSAHLTRTCRDLFGITPTEALQATGRRT